ncbi:MAG TPA: trehalose-phosphatase [Mycobacteriales bacterium]|nr:trehalose-phosphatase [Mycobacteriales bacterium]
MSGPLEALRPLLAETLVALDFDGTLAPIVARPQDARPAPGAVTMLTTLAGRVRQLAIVTGRPAEAVVELGRLRHVPGLVVLGHYGLQRWSGGVVTTPEPVPGVAAARAALPALLPAGASIEDKVHSVVVHTRGHAEPESAQRQLAAPLAELASRYGLELVRGRYVWELRPPGTDKGDALRQLARPLHPRAVLVAGDDLGDLPMFAAAADLGVPAVRVAVVSADAPPQVADAADHVVAGPAALIALLTELTA